MPFHTTLLECVVILAVSLSCLCSVSPFTKIPETSKHSESTGVQLWESETDTRKDNEELCPVWSNSSDCQCGSDLNNVVFCSESTLKVQACYCVYHDFLSNKTYIGYCFFTCFLQHQKLYYSLPRTTNGTLVNELMCNGTAIALGIELHRAGRMCGKCEDGYGLPVYSYHFFQCLKCSQPSNKNWLWFFLIALGPLTIFYFIVIIFNINATSGRLNTYVFCCQIISMPTQMRLTTSAIEALTSHKIVKKMAYAVFSFYGIWNLDFFRMLYDPFCIHPEMTTLQVLALDYIVAFYPVFLTILTYWCVVIHNRRFRVVYILWRPLSCCLTRFRKHWNIQTSLIKVFATFLLLSYVKLLGVSFELLVPTHMFDSNGSKTYPVSPLYYDATIKLFGSDHLPYAILATFVLTLFIVLPLALFCLYPCRWFQSLLNTCGCRCQALHTFMDVYTGVYRYEPRDWRYFAALHVLARIFTLVAFECVLSLYIIPVIAMMALLGAVLVAVIQPNKSAVHNTIDLVGLLGLAAGYQMFSTLILAGIISPNYSLRFVNKLAAIVLMLIPLLYPMAFCVRYIFRRIKGGFNSSNKCCNNVLPCRLQRSDSVESLPDRLEHRDEYEPLITQETAQYSHSASLVEPLSSHSGGADRDTY